MVNFYVYLGPSIKGVITVGTFYNGDRTEVEKQLDYQIKRYPLIKSLLVSSETLPEDRLKVKQPGNRLYEAYRRFLLELNKK